MILSRFILWLPLGSLTPLNFGQHFRLAQTELEFSKAQSVDFCHPSWGGRFHAEILNTVNVLMSQIYFSSLGFCSELQVPFIFTFLLKASLGFLLGI